jgi:hypothetical protein
MRRCHVTGSASILNSRLPFSIANVSERALYEHTVSLFEREVSRGV